VRAPFRLCYPNSQTTERSLSCWTQRSVEASHTIHVLPVNCLVVSSDCADIVARHLGVLRTLEIRKAHRVLHLIQYWARLIIPVLLFRLWYLKLWGARYKVDIRAVQRPCAGLGRWCMDPCNRRWRAFALHIVVAPWRSGTSSSTFSVATPTPLPLPVLTIITVACPIFFVISFISRSRPLSAPVSTGHRA